MFPCGIVRLLGCVILLAATGVAGCRDSEPPRSYYRDVGTDARPLLPTTRSWHAAGVKDGAAEWHPFHSPSELAAEDHRDGEAEPAGGGVEAEIRELIEDYNAAVADGDYDEVSEFLVEGQADTTGQIVETLPALADKVKSLVEALAEVAPQASLELQELPKLLTLNQILELKVDSLEVVSGTEVVGRVPQSAALSKLLHVLGIDEIPGEVHFTFDKDDEYWFIDSPAVAALGGMLATLKESIPQIEALVGGLKSGQVPADAFVGQMGMIGEMLDRLKKGGEEPEDSNDSKDGARTDSRTSTPEGTR